MKWTKMQEAAVLSPVSDILVTAAAGSGKTQVLSGRILNRITNEKADISRMLIMTFTNAAAAEMRERISKKIKEEVARNPKDRHLRRQMALVENADISTVHSFCLKVLRSYFHILGIDPSFKIAEGSDINILKAEALSDAIDFYYESEDENFAYTVDTLCSAKNDNAILEFADDIWRFSESDPFPEKWLNAAKQRYNSISDSPEGFSFYTDLLKEKSIDYLYLAKTAMEKAIMIARENEGLEKYDEVFSSDLSAILSVLENSKDWDLFYNALDYKFPRCPAAKKNSDPLMKEKSKSLRDKAKAFFDKAKSFIPMTYCDAKTLSADMKIQVSSLIDVVLKAMEIFDEKKREKNILDFSDLEHLTIKVLTKENDDGSYSPSDAALEIRDKYDEIYIDEYQDTNEIQETILSMISSSSKGHPNLFMVGDMKQSIYKFRMTNPKKIFGHKSSLFTPFDNKTSEDKHIKIALSKNFRSRKEILDSVNSVFDRLMSEKVGEIEYKGEERLDFGSNCYTLPSLSPALSLNIISSPHDTSSSEQRGIQAEFLAKRINELIKSGVKVYDKEISDFRPLEYRDIVILLRSPKNISSIFENALTKENIPVFSDVDSSFFEYTEIQIFLSLLRIIDNPLQDIDLVSVLRSPVFGFDENSLALLALQRKKYLYNAIKEAAEDEENKKCRYFLARLNTWRKEASFSTPSSFLEYLINDINYLSYVSAMPHADTHLENIDLLINLSRKAEEASYKTLGGFLQYMEKIALSGEGGSPSISDSINSVRIMSIHKSKGLEFPFVFLPSAESAFNLRDSEKPLLLHRDLGIGISAFINPEGMEARKKISLPILDLISETIKEESISEEMRILYVALTRSREHLEILGSVSLKKDEDHFILPEEDEDLSPHKVLSKRSYLDWLILASANNKDIAVNIINHLPSEETTEEEIQIITPEPIEYSEEISSVFEYSYPYSFLKSVKNKYSVSELKHSVFSEDVENYNNFTPKKRNSSLPTPDFLNKKEVFTSAEKGSIMHYVMEHLDLFKSAEEGVKSLPLLDKEREEIDISLLEVFLKSPLAERMRKAEKLYKEEAFTFYKNLSEITKNENDNAEVLIQGVIDCYFFEGDKIILVDYKTDRNVTPKDLKERYFTQLSIYAEALRKRYNMPVSEKLIYSFCLNDTIAL